MKAFVTLFLFFFILIPIASKAQIICIYCYDQNDSISTGVNNLLLNGGFENSTCTEGDNNDIFCPSSTMYSCDITDWICTGGGTATYSFLYDNTQSFAAEGDKRVYFGNGFCNPCSPTYGDTACLSDVLCTVSGIPIGYPLNGAAYGGAAGLSLRQTVNGLSIGDTYILEFWAGGEVGGTAYPNSGLFGVDIGFGDTIFRCKPTLAITGIGSRYIIEFKATSTSHTIKFTNWGHICATCTELVLDDVRLYTLAELSSSVPSCSPCNLSPPVLNTTQNIFCSGDSTQVCAPSGYATYLWNTGETTACIKAQLAGNYYVTVTDNNSCTAESNHLAITVYPLPPVSISVNGDTLSVYSAVTQQWYLNGSAINNATSNIYIVTQGGSYTVQVTDSNGCTATSNPLIISGINNLTEDVVSVFPNPSQNNWQLSVGNNLMGGSIEIFDADGRIVFRSVINSSPSQITLDGSHGVYLLRISSSKSNVIKKLVRL